MEINICELNLFFIRSKVIRSKGSKSVTVHGISSSIKNSSSSVGLANWRTYTENYYTIIEPKFHIEKVYVPINIYNDNEKWTEIISQKSHETFTVFAEEYLLNMGVFLFFNTKEISHTRNKPNVFMLHLEKQDGNLSLFKQLRIKIVVLTSYNPALCE